MKDKDNTRLKDVILRGIEVYNRYRSPEAIAKFVAIKKDGFIIEFKGHFCQSCGVNEYFEDFVYELENISRDFRIKVYMIEPSGPQSFRVRYSFQKNSSIEDEALFKEFLLNNGLSFKEYLESNPCTKDMTMFHFRTWLYERKLSSKSKFSNQ
jgi:hypothetical protein